MTHFLKKLIKDKYELEFVRIHNVQHQSEAFEDKEIVNSFNK